MVRGLSYSVLSLNRLHAREIPTKAGTSQKSRLLCRSRGFAFLHCAIWVLSLCLVYHNTDIKLQCTI